ncbi:MAG: hypothetical protein SWE60_21495 [Thermodesulfobacteriota bacterium]|nr:hypothetical protein [Thermodesulfobacteriota bacterium]MDY6954088.1 hypothetical protein [Thermodesulfobacteriota bacterium]
MLQIQHSCNPLHLYCRLIEKGVNKRLSMGICKCYGRLIYSGLAWGTVLAVEICRFVKRTA